MRRFGLLLAAASIAVVMLVNPAGARSGPLTYVALGDSYSAGSGVMPQNLAYPIDCTQSLLNYPHDIAAATGATLTDVTCGGAETKDFTGQQFPNVAPQLSALSASTRLVTMTIGGNDGGVFINVIADCGGAGLLSLGQGSPCKNQYGSSFANTINNATYPALVKALTAVHQAAPNARVAILSYPHIMPATGGCFPQMPLAAGDVSYVNGIEATLNSAVQRAAAATKTTFINLDAASTGHDACQRIGVRWIEPALLGTNPVIVHPNAYGESQMAAVVEADLGLK